jgi:hypothetical protein
LTLLSTESTRIHLLKGRGTRQDFNSHTPGLVQTKRTYRHPSRKLMRLVGDQQWRDGGTPLVDIRHTPALYPVLGRWEPRQDQINTRLIGEVGVGQITPGTEKDLVGTGPLPQAYSHTV